MPESWPAIAEATRRERARAPLWLDGRAVGSVAAEHLPALRAFAPALRVQSEGVTLTVPAAERDAAFATINAALRAQGLILAWRDEAFDLPDPAGDPVNRPALACIERASARFWGTLTLGAHATGWVAGPDGRPARVWIAQRAFDKATDPGAFDNLIGGGVPRGQSPLQTLQREGWEEAGLNAAVMRRARAARVIALNHDIREGLMVEHIHAFDLQLHADETPVNQDGEVHAFTLLPVDQALTLAASARMTTDAALVTLDFALRHRLLPAAEHTRLTARSAALWRG
jgi:8-oxo-dGTP pyrophosphatase MutT (NUDIX family)